MSKSCLKPYLGLHKEAVWNFIFIVTMKQRGWNEARRHSPLPRLEKSASTVIFECTESFGSGIKTCLSTQALGLGGQDVLAEK